MRLIVLFTLLLFGLAVHANEQPSEEDLNKLKQEIQAAQERINDTQSKKSKLTKTLQQTELALAKIEKKIRQLKKSIEAQQKQLKALQLKERELLASMETQKQEIIAQINISYRLGREKKIKVILNQDDPALLSRTLVYADYLNKARLESIARFRATYDELLATRQSIEDATKDLLAKKEALVKEKQALASSLKQRAKALAALNQSLSNDEKKLAQLKADQTRLEELLRSVNEAIANIQLPSDSTPIKKIKGKLIWPTDGKRDLRFGKKRQPGNLTWEGIAFYADAGTEIKAIHHGRVVFADWFRGKGLLIIIDHGDGYMSLYAHAQTLLRETGDWVSAGETIATVGNTGGLSRPELYFELRKNGKPINPKYWLRKKG